MNTSKISVHNTFSRFYGYLRANAAKTAKELDNMRIIDRIALFLLVVGGLNWGLVGLFEFDLVAWLCGGSESVISRIVYVLVALSALWSISLFFKHNELLETES